MEKGFNPMFKYFSLRTAPNEWTRFKRHRITGSLYVFQSNCVPNGNAWHEPGHGYGVWTRLN